MRVLAITNLFPDSARPGFAPFNRQQLERLSRLCSLTVIAPLPWPRALAIRLRGGRPEPPPSCRLEGEVVYPVYWYTPRVLRDLYGRFYRWSISRAVDRVFAQSAPDVIYATWAYPDCWAAVRTGAARGVPVVSRVHGSDINEYMKHAGRRDLILEALEGSARVITVSEALRDILAAEGVERRKIETVLNGVDRGIFRPADREEASGRLSIKPGRRRVLFAGNLERVKGVDLLIDAFARLGDPGAELVVLGDGPERGRLESLARTKGLGDRVLFRGRVPLEETALWMSACDVFCLPSRNEGTPNVILEALACGTPVVASRTGGIPGIVPGEGGILFPPEDPAALAAALDEALSRDWGRVESPAGTWEDNAARILGILESASGR